MMLFLSTLLGLGVLCAPTSSLCLRLYNSNLLCGSDIISGVKGNHVPISVEFPEWDNWGSPIIKKSGGAQSSAELRGKRTSYPANYKYLSKMQLKSKMFQNSVKNDRRSKFTLSLDVPTNIMNILFDIQKSKNLHAKAADNARLMAQIGRRK